MIDLKNAAATQLTLENGKQLSDWKVSLDGKELYLLPNTFTVQDTFTVRRIIEKMMDYAYKQGKLDMQSQKNAEIEKITELGTLQLSSLKQHNDELAIALERHVADNEASY